MQNTKIINFDKNKWSSGASIYGKSFEIEIRKDKITDDYLRIVRVLMKKIESELKSVKKSRIKKYIPEKKRVAGSRINNEPAIDYTPRDLVKTIKQNEKTRKELNLITKLLTRQK